MKNYTFTVLQKYENKKLPLTAIELPVPKFGETGSRITRGWLKAEQL